MTNMITTPPTPLTLTLHRFNPTGPRQNPPPPPLTPEFLTCPSSYRQSSGAAMFVLSALVPPQGVRRHCRRITADPPRRRGPGTAWRGRPDAATTPGALEGTLPGRMRRRRPRRTLLTRSRHCRRASGWYRTTATAAGSAGSGRPSRPARLSLQRPDSLRPSRRASPPVPPTQAPVPAYRRASMADPDRDLVPVPVPDPCLVPDPPSPL